MESQKQTVKFSKNMVFSNQKGFSLIELMISLTIGLVVIAGIISLFSNSVKSSANIVADAKLNEDLSSILDFISREVKRAGYDGSASSNANTNFGIDDSESTSSCLIYTYDMNGNGTVDSNEKNGIRLNSGSVLFKQNTTKCSSISNGAINDPNTIFISALTFTSNKLCINVNKNNDCNPSSASYSAPSAGDQLVWRREVTISLSGYFTKNSGYVRTVSNTVQVGNDILVIN